MALGRQGQRAKVAYQLLGLPEDALLGLFDILFPPDNLDGALAARLASWLLGLDRHAICGGARCRIAKVDPDAEVLLELRDTCTPLSNDVGDKAVLNFELSRL